MQSRLNTLLDNIPDVILISIFLDPRLKDFQFMKCKEERVKLLERAKELVEQLLWQPGIGFSQGSLMSQDILQDDVGDEIEEENRYLHQMQILFGDAIRARDHSSRHNHRDDELQSYANKKAIAMNVGNRMNNPLEWWKNREERYPRLAKLARRFLAVIATSVPCERIFSQSGWLLNKRRTLLSDERISDLVFIAFNLRQ